MNVIDAIKSRKSSRGFKSELPGREIIRACLEAAAWAPNQSNTQPWRFIVLEGEKLELTVKTLESNFAAAYQEKEALPVPRLDDRIADTLKERRRKSWSEMMEFLKEKGINIEYAGSGNLRFHDAPIAVLFATYPAQDQNHQKATIAALQNFLLAATSKGLGTCWMNAVSICQNPIKKALGLPEDLILVDGVALGYPDDDAPVNQLPRERLPIDNFIDWM